MSKAKSATNYSLTWTHPLTQVEHKVSIRHTRDYLVRGTDHIEVESKVKKQPHPLSETGYRSIFTDPLTLINAGGPVSFVNAEMQRAAQNPQWIKAEQKRAQGDLFQWAEAQSAFTRRKPAQKTPKSQKHAPKRPARARKPPRAGKGRAP